MTVDIEGIQVFLENAIPEHEIERLRDKNVFCPGRYLSNNTRRTLYGVMRSCGFTPRVARRCRTWHLLDLLSLIEVGSIGREGATCP